DLWRKLIVPASGNVNMFLARATTGSMTAWTIGVSVYLASNCTDPSTFRQIGAFQGTLPLTAPTSTNLSFRCLPAGATLYVRFHSLQSAQSAVRRYGQFRFRWVAPNPSDPTPPANNQPCGATPLAFNVSCPVSPGPGGSIDACNTPGIPTPACGGFDGSSRDVWYSFVAPPSGTVFIEASTGAGFPADPAMALYTTGGSGCNGRFTLIECDADQGAGNGARIIRTGLVPGQTYYVRAWAQGSSAQGNFSLCISEPIPPAGSCFYLIDLSAQYPNGTQYMDVTINGGAPTTYSTSPGDASEIILVAIPTGATALFEYYNSGTMGGTTYRVIRLGDPTVLWEQTVGVPVFGPQPPAQYRFTLNNACQPLVPPVSDCLGAKTVCTPNTEFGTLMGTLQPGNRYDLTAANMGCLSTERNGIAWLIFRPVQNGTVAFWFDGTTNGNTADLDFAIWDAGAITYMPYMPNINADDLCAPPGPPVRCSSARRNTSTGLQPGLNGITQEGNGGWGWLSPLSIQADHAYLIALVHGKDTTVNVQYQMRWTQYTDVSGVTSNTMLDCTSLVLPVELLSIDAQAKGQEIEVTWATASESNSSHFIIERSPDAKTFADIGSVEAAGNSQSRIDYHFTDQHPFPGANYYRLRQVDRDGRFAHSDIVVAFMDDRSGHPLLFPNPTTGRVELLMDIPVSGPVMVLITDAVGRALHTEFTTAEHGALRYPLDVSPLAAGAYFVQVVTADGRAIGTAQLMKR
ncbi:MAG: T9SS type A sorting domain-containing protein, partial [Bacteroidetes bacterium]|nr:T9SS type A sorting domain-containing protein [Bacteroidota bacterium]